MRRTVLLLFSLFLMTSLFSETWKKGVTHDRWGDVDGFAYRQAAVGSLYANGQIHRSSVVCSYGYSSPSADTLLLSLVEMCSSALHPGYGDELVFVTVRYNNVASESMVFVAKTVNLSYNMIGICLPRKVLDILQAYGEEQVVKFLIKGLEGDDWYTRIDIHCGLPHIEGDVDMTVISPNFELL